MKLLLVYPPFCTPGMMPYSISNLKGFLKANLELDVKCLDLNAKFHKLRFGKYYEELHAALSPSSQKEAPSTASSQNIAPKASSPQIASSNTDLVFENSANKILGTTADLSAEDRRYLDVLDRFDVETRKIYRDNNNGVTAGQKPEYHAELLQLILAEQPDIVAFSLVYNSQAFYAKALMDSLPKDMKILIGGPADTSKLALSYKFIHDESELSSYLTEEMGVKRKASASLAVPDFSDYNEEDYLIRETIIPVKASSGCCYGQCAFCTHHQGLGYKEADLAQVKQAIISGKAKYLFFIDDLIHTRRLMELADIIRPLGITWSAQLRPTADLLGKLDRLSASGLKSIFWGVESGNERVLKLMKKGTDPVSVSEILKEAHEAGIRNTVFTMFGFPGETREEFKQTIKFLSDNRDHIDLVSTSTFGLQKGSYVYNHPEEYGITIIPGEDRTVLGGTISYTGASGLDREEARRLKSHSMPTIKRIDKLPTVLNYFKEQIMFF